MQQDKHAGSCSLLLTSPVHFWACCAPAECTSHSPFSLLHHVLRLEGFSKSSGAAPPTTVVFIGHPDWNVAAGALLSWRRQTPAHGSAVGRTILPGSLLEWPQHGQRREEARSKGWVAGLVVHTQQARPRVGPAGAT